ncbi:MAG: iron ABC transporter permease [Deltaproteobacteria bacterium]|nr:iron ABC transporter permease [Deltaproteobacteria bacterium]
MARAEQVLVSRRRERAVEAVGDLISGNSIAVFFAWLISGAILALSLLILWMTFIPGLPFEAGFSLANYAEVFGSEHLWAIVSNTIRVGIGTVGITLFFGIPLAWLLNRTDIPMRSLFITMLAVTVIMPGLVKAMGWIMLLSPQVGLINRLLMELFGLQAAPFDINSVWGISFVQGLMLTPSMFFLISGPMRSLDPALEEAAEVVGANRWKTLLWVTSPMLWPAILGGTIYIFMTAIAIFEVAGLLGGLSENRVLATELFLAVQPFEGSLEIKYGVAGVYGLLIMTPSVVALFFYFQSIKQAHRYAVITGKGYRPKTFALGRARYPAVLFVVLYLSLAAFLPFLVLLWASLLPSLRMPSVEALSLVSLRWYQEIHYVVGGFDIIKNTAILVIASSVLVLFFSFMVSWVVIRTRNRMRRFIDTVAMLPHAIPGIGFAFALLIVGILATKWFPAIPFYNTVWILVAGNVLHRLSYATRITNAALIQIQQELEDAALVCGARKWVSMWRVIVPLVRPSLIFAGMWTALLVFREVSMPLLLIGPKNKVFATQLWILWRQGDLSQASALSIVLIFIMGLFILLLQKATGRIGEARAAPQLVGGG